MGVDTKVGVAQQICLQLPPLVEIASYGPALCTLLFHLCWGEDWALAGKIPGIPPACVSIQIILNTCASSENSNPLAHRFIYLIVTFINRYSF